MGDCKPRGRGCRPRHPGLDAIRGLLGREPPRAAEIAVNGRVLLFTAAISIVTGLLASIVPALRLSRVDLVMCQNWIFEKDPDVVRLARRPRSLRPSL